MALVRKQTSFIQDLTAWKENWHTVVRIIRLWFVFYFNRPNLSFSMELVLQDELVICCPLLSWKSLIHHFFIISTQFMQGNSIHGSIRRALTYKFQNDILKDNVYSIQNFSVAPNGGSYRTSQHAYKINFQFWTKVIGVDSKLVPTRSLHYTPLSLLTSFSLDTDYLVSKLCYYLPISSQIIYTLYITKIYWILHRLWEF